MASLQVDCWDSYAGSGDWPVDAHLPAMRRLDLDVAAFGYAVDPVLGPLLKASRGLVSLRLWGMLLSELKEALLPALTTSLRQLCLGILADEDYDAGRTTALSRNLAEALAPQLATIELGTCSSPAHYASWGPQRAEILALASAWIAAVPAVMASGVTVSLRPSRRLVTDADGYDDGAFAALVPRFEAIGVRCRLEIGAPNAVSLFADLLAD